MSRILSLSRTVFLGALFAATSQLAFGEDNGESEFPIAKMTLDYRTGKQIESNQLGDFLTESLSVEFGDADVESFSVMLRVEVISKEEGVIGVYDSRTTDCFPIHYYPASTWIRSPREINEQLAPGFGDRRKITVGRSIVINHEEQYVARECEDATHAMQLTLGSNNKRFSGLPTGKRQVCLIVER